ncbi:MAG: dihydroneopterin aldolase [Ferruginibacter sp.]
MFTIHVDKMKFFAHHGWHDEEGITGTEFEVSVAVTIDPPGKILALQDTVNYITVFDIVKERFSRPAKLLETLATDITEEIYKKDGRILSINITIDKINPPISNFTGTAGIRYSKSFKE